MAPNSRIILTRHAQAEHNVDLDYYIPDAPLTPLGKKQAASLVSQVKSIFQEVDLVVSSPLKRTLQTTKLGWKDSISRLGGLKNVVCLPQAQECNDFPCDTGSSKQILLSDPEFQDFTDLENLPEDWTSKKGFWSPENKEDRAKWVRQWLKQRPEKTIVLVAHGDILRSITASQDGPSTYMWKNAEARIFTFDAESVDSEECFLWQEKGKEVAVAGGYAPSSTEADILMNGNL